MLDERWHPVYDANDLKDAINKLSSSSEVEANFYGSRKLGPPYQGDIIELDSELPVILAGAFFPLVHKRPLR